MQDYDRDTLARFAENLPGGVLCFSILPDGSQICELLNKGVREIYGLPEDADVSDPSMLWQMVDPLDLEAMQISVADSASNLTIWEHRFRITDAHNRRKTIVGRGTPKPLDTGGVEWITFLFDISEQVGVEQRFREVSEQVRLVSEAIPDGFALFDVDERIVICNRKFRDLYELHDGPELPGLTYADVLYHAAQRELFPASIGKEQAWIAQRLASFREAAGAPEDRHGAARWFRILDRPTLNGGRVAFRIETTRTRNREAELERAVLTDSLTGLWNRQGLATYLRDKSLKLAPNEAIALICIDLDKFKAINDTAGHEAGDAVLLEVARRLSRLAGPRASIARLGGDEFVVAIPTLAPEPEMIADAEKIRLKVVDPIKFGTKVLQIGASFGFAYWRADQGVSIEQGVLDADSALLKGKALGRNRTVRFEPAMRVEARRHADLAGNIKEALAKEEFVPFFQPQVDLAQNKAFSVEVLARWRLPDGSFRTAGEFIPIAVETGLIKDIDALVFGRSTALLRDLHHQTDPDLSIAVNLSTERLRQPDIVESLLDQLFVHGLSSHHITIEILESTLLDDRTNVIADNIHALSNAGFRIELDDFGTGHTALASLRAFPVDQIKIDRSLIHNVHNEPKSHAIVEGIFLMADRLGVGVLAEGVEQAEDLEALRAMGITRYQGYVFSEPMSCTDLEPWLVNYNRARKLNDKIA